MPTPFVADAADEAVRSESILRSKDDGLLRVVYSRDLVARELEDGRVGRAMYREPKIKRKSDATEEPKVRGVLKSAHVPCEARGANISNQTLEYCALGGRF